MTDDVLPGSFDVCAGCCRVNLFPLLIIVLLAPGCPIDNVSVDKHLTDAERRWA